MLMTLYIFIPSLILASYSSWLLSNPKDIKPSELLGSLSRLGSMTLLWSGSQLGQSKRPATNLRLVLLLYMRYPYPDHLILIMGDGTSTVTVDLAARKLVRRSPPRQLQLMRRILWPQ